jgi:Protein of unknown function (DUF2798)
MSLAMSFALSGFFTLMAFSISERRGRAWISGFAVGWPLAFALSLLIGTPARRLAEMIVFGGRA